MFLSNSDKKVVDRRRKYPLQVLILAAGISLAQFFCIWFIYLATTGDGMDIHWTPVILQLILNFSFSFLLISMAYRSFHLSRMVSATSRTLEEKTREYKFNEATLQLSKEQAESVSQAKTAYLANMSHELRTPMNSIVGFSEILLDEPLNEEQLDYVNTIYLNSKHLLSLINDVLDLSKIEAGRLTIVKTSFSLTPFIEQLERIIQPTAHAKGLRIEVISDESLPEEFYGDEMHIRQCLINLLSNAIKFTPHGTITFRIMTVGYKLRFEVTDPGIGIAEDKLESILLPFVQADKSTSHEYGGTGLGLAITKQLAELMDGTLSVQSTLTVGSTFTLDLPCSVPTYPVIS